MAILHETPLQYERRKYLHTKETRKVTAFDTHCHLPY